MIVALCDPCIEQLPADRRPGRFSARVQLLDTDAPCIRCGVGTDNRSAMPDWLAFLIANAVGRTIKMKPPRFRWDLP